MISTLTKISVYSHKNDLGDKVWNPAIRWKHKYAVFIVLKDSTGNTGVGECWCFDTLPDTLITYLRTEVIPHFVGCDLSHTKDIVLQLYRRATLTARHGILSSALAGLDIALCDLRARQVSLPLCEWLTPKIRTEVPIYASGGLYGENKNSEALAAEMLAMVNSGFNRVKMKIGALTVERDAERINRVLSTLPSSVDLIIDGVYSYDIASALDLMARIPAARIAAFQSPLPAQDIAGMRELNKSGVPVMATEAEYRSEIHRQLVEQNAVTYLQTSPIACGGITKLQELDDLVAGSSIKLSLEVSSTALAFLVACHFASAYRSVAHVEYHCLHQVFFDQLTDSIHPEKSGFYRLPKVYGLGFELDLESVKREFYQSV